MIPRMLDDAFKIVIDPIFKIKERKEKIYSIKGYEDDLNMWELMKSDQQL